jgi:exosortase/archaeosortase family protein
MSVLDLKHKNIQGFLSFIIRFLGFFFFFYYLAKFLIALTAQNGFFYSPWFAENFDVIGSIKNSLIWGARSLLDLLGYDTYVRPGFIVRIFSGRGVRIAHGCVGYGVYSFWLAYMFSIRLKTSEKLIWIFVGLFFLWSINVLRISLLLLALNKNWPMPLGIDHHDWFNIISYLFIFVMIYVIDKRIDNKYNREPTQNPSTLKSH